MAAWCEHKEKKRAGEDIPSRGGEGHERTHQIRGRVHALRQAVDFKHQHPLVKVRRGS